VSATLVAEAGGATVLSSSMTVPDGARGTLLLVPGRFRLDVQSAGDTLRTSVRHLAGGSATVSGPGYAGPVHLATEPDDVRPSRYDLTVELESAGRREEVRVLIGAMGDSNAGVTTFTAQAIVQPA
jgi:hypothetical protein